MKRRRLFIELLPDLLLAVGLCAVGYGMWRCPPATFIAIGLIVGGIGLAIGKKI
jgi:hypothetical protein